MSCGEKSNAFANLHDVTLQRLDVYHRNNGGYVFYDSKHFAPTVDHWNTVPVIYVETEPGKPGRTSQFKDVITRTLPAKFRTVGSVSAAHLTETGEKVLKGAIVFSDPAIAAKANAGELSLSTGLASPEAPDPRLPGATRIAGPVTPNHILVFDRGACRTAIRTTVEQCSTIYRNQTCLTTKPRDCSSGLPTRSPGASRHPYSTST